MVTNTAQDMLMRISFPSNTNLQDITVFVTRRIVFSRPKYVKTTSEVGAFLRLCYIKIQREHAGKKQWYEERKSIS